MRRREFVALLSGAAAWTFPARAQPQTTMPVVGYLGPESPQTFASRVNAFRDGLAQAGYVEGRNVAIEFRWAEGHYDRLSALAADLVDRQVALLVAPGGAPVALAAKSATATIPIVFEMGGDPVALGVVRSLNRPEGNLTGVSSLSVALGPKRIELLHEMLPTAATIAVVVNPTSPTAEAQRVNMDEAAKRLGLRLHVLHASTEQEFGAVFDALPQIGASGLAFTSDPFYANRSQQLARLAVRHGIPAVHQSRDFTLAGGLMSYGGNFVQSHRQAGAYAGRILRGEKPSDLPVQQVTSVELLINLKAASALGITVPLALIARADEVIE
jgi:putative tryptophan/tyrosine transport system substrate-binding protein